VDQWIWNKGVLRVDPQSGLYAVDDWTSCWWFDNDDVSVSLYATDRRETDMYVRQHHRFIPPPIRGGTYNKTELTVCR